MACGCGSRAARTADNGSTASATEPAARFEVRDNKGQVSEFSTRAEAQVFLARNGGVLKPI